MKKKISLFLLCFLVASCAGQEETSPTATEEDAPSPPAVEEETKENSQLAMNIPITNELLNIWLNDDIINITKIFFNLFGSIL